MIVHSVDFDENESEIKLILKEGTLILFDVLKWMSGSVS
jgi:hypothetical protein